MKKLAVEPVPMPIMVSFTTYLSAACATANLNPEHISFYQLTIEPNTYFAKFPPVLPKDDDIWQMGSEGVNLLEKNGYMRYEVSAFGKVPSKHNLNYWQFGDYCYNGVFRGFL